MAGARGIYGLSGSGIDVESLVKVGMMSEQKKYDRIYKKEVETEWRKEAFADVYSAVNTFRSSMSDMRLSSRTKPMTATSSLSDAVTATANANAGVMSHTVEVTQAASNAYLMTASGQKVARTNTAAPTSVALKDVAFAGGTMPAGMTSTDTALSFKLSNGTGTTEIKFTAEEVFTKNLTLNDLAKRINNARFIDSDGKKSALNITASYDAVSDAFSIVNTKSGSDNKVSLSVDTGAPSATYTTALLNNLKLGQVSGGSISAPLSFTISGTTAKLEAAGANASVKVDGRTYTNLQDNKLQVNGVTYTFKKATPVGTPAQVTIAQDQDKLVENVKKFVEDYNKLLDDLHGRYNNNKYPDYGVLTKEQEAGMSREQVDKWNERAKSGLLYRDGYLRSIISDMRDAVTNRVGSAPGRYNNLAAIGITSKDQSGHLKLDENKLRTAIAAEPDAVNQIFSHTDDDDNYGDNGVATRLAERLGKRMESLKSHAGITADKSDRSELGKLIENYEKQMSDFKQLMSSFENQLYKKYNAMEEAISKLSSQFGFFSRQ
ncbi:flagellar filament capping protein FliD [Selenomonas sp. oral taxon 149]|uniref:flagellar filament capping protein FliD n=1 Tax=Selenomonas sp. oral taxon 149 TaxID=712535 RepID=UPI0001E0EAAC|nr:flagellar filament capping protein FliD [Selenomonas sp. oral taxon 149]EFM22518.1 flagellar hook-associated protein 2 [Selenomonas sp. oral taxon 149 str. 67H29BP]